MPAKILIVDDQAANLLALEAVLAVLGREIVRAQSGEEALKRVLSSDFAVVLLDMKMGGLDGIETATHMRSIARTRDTPIIFITAYESDVGEVRRAYDLGAFDFITKPFDADILRYKVAGFVRLYEQAEQLRQQDMFIGVLSHDLRNSLGAIAMAADLLGMKSTLSDDDRRIVERITRSSGRMKVLIHDVLDLTRGRVGGGIPVSRQRAALDEICRQVVDELQAAYEKRPIAVEVKGDVVGQWDPARIGQVVSNLIGNALAHSPSGPISVVIDGGAADSVRLSVSNSGCIPSDVLPRLFEPFRPSQRNSAAGLGLGLYIVRELVHSHGGRVEVRSDTPGDQTTFTVELPRAGSAKPKPRAETV